MVTELEKVDIIRERTGVSYRTAKDALDKAGGDVVEALVSLEDSGRARTWRETFQVQGSELVERVRQLVHEGNVNRILVLQDGRTLLEVPVTVGAIGAVFLPTLAALGVVAALVTRCTILVERRQTDDDHGDEGEGADGAGFGSGVQGAVGIGIDGRPDPDG